MDIAEELRMKAEENAGSPQGFSQVLQLVLEEVERGELESVFSPKLDQLQIEGDPLKPGLPSFPPVTVYEDAETARVELFLNSTNEIRPEWLSPEEYLPILRGYLYLTRQVVMADAQVQELDLTPSWNLVDFNIVEARKRLVELQIRARKKAKELPPPAYKRLKRFENSHSLLGRHPFGAYYTENWQKVNEEVVAYVTDWGLGA